ncbi:SLC13 family permease [Natrialba asiatica]|uniref:Citrate transporter n=1 Tax=Natrialba asiatica (strain ATCC 700177 / DSM 12278 / JCM 9576 / FERM P-10747 / NBRC 102637 / 172P1) TaxID=29540 RepID=M0AL88_NATA1|nr:SLC13 family permease [Natrialba asiatica]ELY98138.1 Citrate transporter [Natrialba asiatica DSM 12278]
MPASAPLIQETTTQPQLTTDMIVVFGVVVLALIFFLTERLPVDVTAILLIVILVVLEPWTGIDPATGISGFANEATITVLAMLILSGGISRTGIVQELGRRMAAFAGTSVRKQLFATVAVTSPVSGVLNNTPVVALLVPVVTDVANRGNTSPSKLLIPLSYASQVGGMLTLIGTSTNILASDVSARLGTTYPELHRFSMFEFTRLGLIVALVGGLYLIFVSHYLLPERVPPRADYLEEYAVSDYVADVAVVPGSPLVDGTVRDATEILGPDIDIVQVVRNRSRGRGREPETDADSGSRSAPGRAVAPRQALPLTEGDVLVVRTNRDAITELAGIPGVEPVTRPQSTAALSADADEGILTELVVSLDSRLVGDRLDPEAFREEFNAAVLGLRSRGELVSERIVGKRLDVGDTLLVQAPPETLDRLARRGDMIVAREPPQPDYRTDKAPIAVAIMVGVVAVATLEFYPILIAALAGVVAMVGTGVLEPNELYDAVEWDIIFLLAGVIPLGIALEQTGSAAYLASLVVSTADFLPTLVVLWLFYIVTGLITEVISNNASVVLLLPVAAAAAAGIGSNPFAFVLAVTFAASTAFLGPIGYQTNLFVYGPGGYRFGDYFRVGAPLQLILSVVTVLGIAFFWGV